MNYCVDAFDSCYTFHTSIIVRMFAKWQIRLLSSWLSLYVFYDNYYKGKCYCYSFALFLNISNSTCSWQILCFHMNKFSGLSCVHVFLVIRRLMNFLHSTHLYSIKEGALINIFWHVFFSKIFSELKCLFQSNETFLVAAYLLFGLNDLINFFETFRLELYLNKSWFRGGGISILFHG